MTMTIGIALIRTQRNENNAKEAFRKALSTNVKSISFILGFSL